MKKISILDLEETLEKDDSIKKATSQEPLIRRKTVINKKTLITNPKTVETLISDASQVLGIDPQEIHEWIAERSVPQCLLKPILLTSQRLRLNPLLGQIGWELNEKNHWEVFIPIDGWIAMIHREPSFKGMTFNESNQTENGIPVWIACSIYRSDLTHPITVREYFIELKTEHPMWVQMPRRMLRHKTLQQCARLAFGISVPELKIPLSPPLTTNQLISRSNEAPLSTKGFLKQQLASSILGPATTPNAPSVF